MSVASGGAAGSGRGGVHPRFSGDIFGHVDDLLEMGIRCLKIHPSHQLFPANAHTQGLETLGAIYRRCEDRGLPVMVHTGTSIFPAARNKYGQPMDLDDVAVDFPDLTIVMAHGGRPLWMDECMFLLRRHPNVQMDISGIPPRALLDYFPRLAEVAHKTMFGTDWPGPGVPGVRGNVEAFRALPLAAVAREAILAGTADRIYPSRP